MILRHRKRHLGTWIVLALILPVAFALSWSVIPENQIEPVRIIDKDIEVSTVAEEPYLILEIRIHSPATSPGLIVLLGDSVNGSIDDSQIIGQIQGIGTYRFQLPEGPGNQGYILLYDPFNRKVNQSLEL